MPEETIITITGHRPTKLGGYDHTNPLAVKVQDALETKMTNAVNKFDNVVFRIGMAIGTDQMAGWICANNKFTFDAYVPFEGQESRWPQAVQNQYRTLLALARNVYVTHDGPYPGAWVMQKRNEQMVDGADYVLSVYDGSPGGTANCIRYAQEQGVRVVNINPREL